MVKINNLTEMEKYYVAETNTYEFTNVGRALDVLFDYNINITSNIYARNIIGNKINALNIDADSIMAWSVNGRKIDVSYVAVKDIIECWKLMVNSVIADFISADYIFYQGSCAAYQGISCVSIKGSEKGSKHFSIYGKVKCDRKPLFKEMTLSELERKLGMDKVIIKG